MPTNGYPDQAVRARQCQAIVLHSPVFAPLNGWDPRGVVPLVPEPIITNPNGPENGRFGLEWMKWDHSQPFGKVVIATHGAEQDLAC